MLKSLLIFAGLSSAVVALLFFRHNASVEEQISPVVPSEETGSEPSISDALPSTKHGWEMKNGGGNTPPVAVRAARVFSGPSHYPPEQFAAYGIVAFRTRPSVHDRDRFLMICDAYVASLPHTSELLVSSREQMVTVWPLQSDAYEAKLNDYALTHAEKQTAAGGECGIAVDNYGLVTSQQALKEAAMVGVPVTKRGPLLLAWSPSATKGKPDALVLVSDLSNVTTYQQALDIFVAWSRDIEANPALWRNGWNIGTARVYIQHWVDKYGSKALAVYHGWTLEK